MNFSVALEALKEGKKIKSKKYGTFFLKDGYLYYEQKTLIKLIHGFAIYVILADDWEIIEDILDVKLQRSTDTYFKCPKCGAQWEVIVYSEDIINNENIRECCKCGKKVKIVNLGEFNTKRPAEEILSEYKEWLTALFDSYEEEFNRCLRNKQYRDVVDAEVVHSCYKYCLETLNRMENDLK